MIKVKSKYTALKQIIFLTLNAFLTLKDRAGFRLPFMHGDGFPFHKVKKFKRTSNRLRYKFT
ncbi:hypothetical protein LX92_02391 [Maribacter polysiphoniae]|uniref:Uncharacterized protein n=1 Tax=Maribacter polysiphoniae TaxID=429344 RepID=A0A316E0J0_9FLAO|nr:hypothetical protein LX92_02391 [Maribacter polysiphoniae]